MESFGRMLKIKIFKYDFSCEGDPGFDITDRP